MSVILWLLLKLLFLQAQNESKIEIKRHLRGLVSSSHDVPVTWTASPTGLHCFLFCTSFLNIQCAERKLNKNYQCYNLFKPGAFVRKLGLLLPEGPSLCQQAAWPIRSRSVDPGAWCWEPDVHATEVRTSSSLDFWTGHQSVIREQAPCSCSMPPGFAPLKHSGDMPTESQVPVLGQRDSYWTNVNFSHPSSHLD